MPRVCAGESLGQWSKAQSVGDMTLLSSGAFCVLVPWAVTINRQHGVGDQGGTHFRVRRPGWKSQVAVS